MGKYRSPMDPIGLDKANYFFRGEGTKGTLRFLMINRISVAWKSRKRLLNKVADMSPTPPKFNIAPEKWWLEYYFPIGKVTFQGLC